MLRLACQNEEFRTAMLNIMREGSTSCGDRTILFFNDIEVQWHLHHKELSEPDLAKLAIRIQRYELLKAHAKLTAGRIGNGDEEIETILYHCNELKNDLDLPISTEHMLNPNCADMTPALLDQAKVEIGAISDLDLLSQSETWRAHLKKDPEVAAQFQQIISVREEAQGRLDATDLLETDEFAYAEQSRIIREREERSCAISQKP